MAERRRKAKPAEPEPDLTVSAVVTVFVAEDGSARVVVKVDSEGHEALVVPMKAATSKLNIVGAGLQRVVMNALSVEQIGPSNDLLAVAARAGRA